MRRDYPFVAPYCRYMGSYDYFRRDEIQRLTDMNAPNDAYATRYGGGYYSVSQLREPGMNGALADMLEREAGITADQALGKVDA